MGTTLSFLSNKSWDTRIGDFGSAFTWRSGALQKSGVQGKGINGLKNQPSAVREEDTID